MTWHFDHANQNDVQSTFHFREFVSTCRKSNYFIFFLQRHKNSNSKNHIFGPLPQFLGQFFFLQFLALSRTTSYVLLAPCENLEKTNDPIPRKHLDRRMDRLCFIGPFPLLPAVQ